MITTTIPIYLISEANVREHHMAKAKRRKIHRESTHWALKQFARPTLPVVVDLTRHAPRFLDTHDNLPMSMKAVVDGICDWLGIDDKDDRIQFRYGQTKSEDRAVHLRITTLRSDVPQCSTLSFNDMRMIDG